MSEYLKKLVLVTAVFGILTIVAGTAKADIVVVTGVNNQGTDNVLLNPALNASLVTGTVGQNNLVVNFTSTSGNNNLNANPSGQATVSGALGNSPHDATHIWIGRPHAQRSLVRYSMLTQH